MIGYTLLGVLMEFQIESRNTNCRIGEHIQKVF